MTIHDGVQWVTSIGMVGLVLLARDRLRMNAPRTRVALGVAAILLATLVFLSVMRLLPRPWENGFSTLIDMVSLVACSVFAGLLVLSLIEIAGGTVQAVRRWKYSRRSVR